MNGIANYPARGLNPANKNAGNSIFPVALRLVASICCHGSAILGDGLYLMVSEYRKQQMRDYSKVYRAQNPEIVKARRRAWRDANKLHRKAYNRDWRKNNPIKCNLQKKRYHKTQSGTVSIRLSRMRKRARKMGCKIVNAGVRDFVSRLLKRRTFVCHYCSKPFRIKLLNFEHIRPLSKGGQHRVENLCASCPSCNTMKAETPIQWLNIKQPFLL